MATTLTTSYQIISTINISYGQIRTYAKYNSQSVSGNTTSISLKSTYYCYQWVEFSSATGNLDGTTRGYGYTRMNAGETTISEVTRTIYHNTDGSSPAKSVSTSWSASFGGGGSTSASVVAPKINRLAVLNSFTGNDVDGTFKASYTSYVGSFTYKLRLSIPGKTLQTKNYSNNSNFTLDTASIDAVYSYALSKNVSEVGITAVIETWNGSTKLGESGSKTNNCSLGALTKIRINGAWKRAITYIRVNNAWKRAIPHVRVNGAWKRTKG